MLTLEARDWRLETGNQKLETRNWRLDPAPQASSLKPQVSREAEACFLKAIEIARQQSAKSFELRAVVSLSRLRQRQGKKEEARQMLEEIYGWFTEGFDTADLQEARAVLEELEEHPTVAPREKRRETKKQSAHVTQRRGETR